MKWRAYYLMMGGRRLGLSYGSSRAEAIRRCQARYYYLRLKDYELEVERWTR